MSTIHFFDPVVILGLMVDHMTAVKLRVFLLAFYCLFTLSRLYRQQLSQGTAPGALFYPSFGYPHFSYITPLLPLIFIPLILGPKKGLVARRVGVLVLLIAALFTLGVIGDGIEPLRQRLPSAMRYHLSIIPFLCCLFLVYSRESIEH